MNVSYSANGRSEVQLRLETIHDVNRFVERSGLRVVHHNNNATYYEGLNGKYAVVYRSH